MLVKEGNTKEILGPDADDRCRYKLMLAGIEEVKGFGFIVGNIKPGGGTKPHTHDDHGEVYYVIRGKGKFKIGQEEFLGEEGTALYVSPNKEHSMENIGDDDMKLILLQVPLSRMK